MIYAIIYIYICMYVYIYIYCVLSHFPALGGQAGAPRSCEGPADGAPPSMAIYSL